MLDEGEIPPLLQRRAARGRGRELLPPRRHRRRGRRALGAGQLSGAGDTPRAPRRSPCSSRASSSSPARRPGSARSRRRSSPSSSRRRSRKQQILTLYCNLVFLGHGNYGMESAARDYFGHGVARADAPRGRDSRRHRAAAERVQPLSATPSRSSRGATTCCAGCSRRASSSRGRARRRRRRAAGACAQPARRREIGPYFAEEVRQHLETGLRRRAALPRGAAGADHARPADPARGRGRRCATGCCDSTTAAAVAARSCAARALDLEARRRSRRSPGRNPVPDAGFPASSWQPDAGAAPGPDRRGRRLRVEPAGIAWTGRSACRVEHPARRRRRLVPAGADPTDKRPGDRLDARAGAAVSRAPRSCSSRPPARCARWSAAGTSSATSSTAPPRRTRQVGSAFKPFVYGAALESGFTPADTLFDAPAVFLGADGLPSYSPRNYYRRYYGILTLRRALEHSVNVTAVKLLDLVGVARVDRLRPPLRHHVAAAALPEPGARLGRPHADGARRGLRRPSPTRASSCSRT